MGVHDVWQVELWDFASKFPGEVIHVHPPPPPSRSHK